MDGRRSVRMRRGRWGKRLVRNPDDLQNGSLKRQSASSDEGGWGPKPHTLTSQNTKVRPEAMLSQARQIRHQPTPAGAFSDLGSVVSQQQRARHQASLERKAAAARVSPQRQTSVLRKVRETRIPSILTQGLGRAGTTPRSPRRATETTPTRKLAPGDACKN